ncbi:MAG TPA: UbiA family prenyltransferase [candidate division Zixibacteria bacterium]
MPTADARMSPRNTAAAWWSLIRGGNVLMAGAASLLGLVLAAPNDIWPQSLPAVLPPMLICAAGYIDNDICDRAIDRHIKPARAIVSGRVRLSAARAAAGAFTMAGVLLASVGGWPALVAVLVVVACIAWYNRALSARPLIGNVAVAAIGAFPIIYGALHAPLIHSLSRNAVLLAALTAFWLHWGREILKDVVDVDGDRVVGRRTLPIVLSPDSATRLAGLPLLLGAVSALWLGLGTIMAPIYLFGVCVTVIPAVLLGAAQCALNPSTATASRWVAGAKLSLAGGLIWMFLGAT